MSGWIRNPVLIYVWFNSQRGGGCLAIEWICYGAQNSPTYLNNSQFPGYCPCE